MQLGTSTYAYLYQYSLEDSLREIARAGYTVVEIANAQPHIAAEATGLYERRCLTRLMTSLGLECVSVNPTELNLISPNAGLRRSSLAQYIETIRFARDIGAAQVVVVPGRRSALSPSPEADSLELLEQQLAVLVPEAKRAGVVLALETSPYGFLGTGGDVARVVDLIGDEHLAIAFDCANVVTNEDVAQGVRDVAHRLSLAHVSDTWLDRFAHTSPGRGDIDFQAYADALREIGWDGPTIYELVDGEDPVPRSPDDIARFESCGWSLGA